MPSARLLFLFLLIPALSVLNGSQSVLEQARKLIAQGEYRQARTLLEPMTDQNTGDWEIHYLYGLACFRLEEPSIAVSHFQVAAELKPRDPQIMKLLARACIAAGLKSNGEEILLQLTELAPRDYEVWSLLGRIKTDNNQFTDALLFLREAIRLNPGDVLGWAGLGFAQVGLGLNEQALESYRSAIKLNMQLQKPLASPHASYAMLLLRLDRVEEAEKQIRLALAIDPKSRTALEAQRALGVRAISKPGPAAHPEVFSPPVFEDVAERSGLAFRLENSPTPAKHQIETMLGGVAVLDYDNDGLMDIYFTNGAESPSLNKSDARYTNRLFHNDGNLHFSDVTQRAGVGGSGFMTAAAAADYDNDGFADLLVLGVRKNILYHNNGDGTFTDVTRAAGLDKPDPRFGNMWAVHGAWFDYDRDGWLDLLIVNYCIWDPEHEPYCGDNRPGHRAYCHPRMYKPLPNRLYHNNRDGTFTDVSGPSGIGRYLGKGMGAAVGDFDDDGWLDIFVANDTEPNFLFRNRGDGTFEEMALKMQVALNQFGMPLSCMGADFRDLDNDGRPDLFVTALSNECWLLFRNTGTRFEDIADSGRVGLASMPYGGWSNAIVDLNNDGWKDLFSANSHVMDNIELTQSRKYRQRNSVLANSGDGTFRDVSDTVGGDFQREAAHRGSAVADFDNDGRMDIIVTALGDRSELFHNISPSAGHWLTVRLIGTKSNRAGLGALLCVETPDGRRLWNHASTSVGFASSSDPRVHFGLGRATEVKRLEVTWPGGWKQVIEKIPADRVLTLKEDR